MMSLAAAGNTGIGSELRQIKLNHHRPHNTASSTTPLFSGRQTASVETGESLLDVLENIQQRKLFWNELGKVHGKPFRGIHLLKLIEDLRTREFERINTQLNSSWFRQRFPLDFYVQIDVSKLTEITGIPLSAFRNSLEEMQRFGFIQTTVNYSELSKVVSTPLGQEFLAKMAVEEPDIFTKDFQEVANATPEILIKKPDNVIEIQQRGERKLSVNG